MSIEVIENILSEQLLKDCQDLAQEVLYSTETRWRSNMTWQNELKRKSNTVLVYEIKKNNQNIFNRIRKEIKDKTGKHINDLLIHFWPPLSYLDWHDDGVYSDAVTIYLNKEWSPSWGGYFLYNENDNIRGVIPKENLGIHQKGGIPHCVTTINVDSDIRVSLQAFLLSSKKIL